MKSAALSVALGLSVLVGLGTVPGVSRGDSFRTDFAVDFQSPDPAFTGSTLDGTLALFFQPATGGGLISLGQAPVSGLDLGTSVAGSLSFDLDLSGGPGNLFLSFDGILIPPGPPVMPAYAFLPDPGSPGIPPGPPVRPDTAPLLDLGMIGFGMQPPGPPVMPLFAFAGVLDAHEIGSLQVTVSAVPEPGVCSLLGVGLGLLGWARSADRATPG